MLPKRHKKEPKHRKIARAKASERRLDRHNALKQQTERQRINAKFKHFDIDGMWKDRTLIRGFVGKKTLEGACEDARKLYELKLSSGKHSPFDKPASVLKRAIYQIGIIAIHFEQTKLLKKLARDIAAKEHCKTKDDTDGRRLPNSAPPHKENPFYYAFYIAFPDPHPKQTRDVEVENEATIVEDRRRINQTNNERSKVSRQLVYAYRNDVPPQLLIGFIYQTGGSRVIDARLNGELPYFSPLGEQTKFGGVVENHKAWSKGKDKYWPIPLDANITI